jgi:hypothetical protein
MPQKRMAELYGVDVRTISYHLGEIFQSGELAEKSVLRKIGITALRISMRNAAPTTTQNRKRHCYSSKSCRT